MSWSPTQLALPMFVVGLTSLDPPNPAQILANTTFRSIFYVSLSSYTFSNDAQLSSAPRAIHKSYPRRSIRPSIVSHPYPVERETSAKRNSPILASY